MRSINNYEELVAERKKVEAKILVQKSVINEGINDLKEKFEPFTYILPALKIFSKSGNNSFLKGAASVGIDLLVGQNLLSKSNWLTRLVVPLFLKKFSSKVIGGNSAE